LLVARVARISTVTGSVAGRLVPLGNCATVEIKPQVAVTATNNRGDDTLAFPLAAMGKKLAVNEGSPGESGWSRSSGGFTGRRLAAGTRANFVEYRGR